MFRLDELESDVYHLKGNYGFIRMGDLIAVMAINEAMRIHYKKKIFFNMMNCPMDANARSLMAYFPERITDAIGPHWPYGGNAWLWWDYIHTIMKSYLKINNAWGDRYEDNKAIVNPLMNAPYNIDRNWNEDLVNDLIESIRSAGYEVVLVGEEAVVNNIRFTAENEKLIKIVCGTMDLTIREIMTAKVYAGGDTGITHFAATTAFAPKKLIAIYGDRSEMYHARWPEMKQDIDRFLNETLAGKAPELESVIKANFSPKPNKDKEMYYTMQSQINYEILENFLRS